ncbi:hypothetical protein C8Q78DRAFT_1081563 [Trametes maxima]|nr:hypothetical protein C8Q78DRAFT_1081563 [Trametes maxima]
MASTSTTETRSREKRDTVPLLLESFPVPPSFIPPSPLLSNSPGSPLPRPSSPFISPVPSPATKLPPSAPPSAPLPPVPGPSPITEHETLMFITAARSRRSSKMSLASTSSHYSRRDSSATVASNASGSSLHSFSPPTSVTLNDSSRSLRSYPSSSSLSVPGSRHYLDKSPIIQPRIAEEDAADLTRLSLDEISMHSPLPKHLSDDERVLEVGIGPSLSRQPGSEPRTSFSSMEAREGHSRADDGTPAPATAAGPSTPPRPRIPSSGRARSRVERSVDKDLPPLPPPTQPPPHAPPQVPATTSSSSAKASRAGSPDIKEILATTPRPRRRSSHGSGLRSRSTSRSVRSLKRRVSEGVGAHAHAHASEPSSRRTSTRSSRTSLARGADSLSELAYEQSAMAPVPAHAHEGDVWDEDSFVSDYGVPVDSTGTPYEMFDRDEEARLERELDGDGSDSDSSLDLHTPLPHLMVRDGLLSANSKLVQASRNNTPLPNDRPGSVFSVASTAASVMTKSGLFKDERDTVKRRVRHRDGRLLAGGIGLTTGLGWSDSEDEDAPSPLIRQISTRSLKKRAASQTSLRSVVSNSALSRSYGGHMPESRMDEFGVLPKVPRSSLPPTSWQKPRTPAPTVGRDWRTSTSSSVSSASSASYSNSQSRMSVVSHRSAPTSSSSRRGLETTPLSMNMLGHIREGDEVGFNTPSTSSTASLPMPTTPDDIPIRSRTGSLGTKKVPARLDLVGAPELEPRDVVVITSASPSSSSTYKGSSPPALSTPTAGAVTTAPLPRQTVPRPLRLPQSAGTLRRATEPSMSSRTPGSAPIPPAPGSAAQRASAGSLRQKPSLSALRPPSATRPGPAAVAMSAPPQDSGISFPSRSPAKPAPPVSRSASANATGAPRARPRTGTGMAYRTGGSSASTPTAAHASMGPPASVPVRSHAVGAVTGIGTGTPAGARPSMLRMPSTTSLRSAKGVGIAL